MRSRLSLWSLLCVMALAWGSPAFAQMSRLRDLEPQLEQRVELQWASPIERAPETLTTMRARVPGVAYQLDTSRFVGRLARIYYVIPLDAGLSAPQGLSVDWRARGELNSGRALAGERAMVFQGRIGQPRVSAWFDLDLLVDSRYFSGQFRFEPYFEIELD